MFTQFNSTISWRGSTTALYRHTDYFCYLLHFETKLGNPGEPRGQAQHYLGVTSALDCRLLLHKNKNGAAIMAAVGKAGVAWEVARLWRVESWEESRDLEHALKRRHNSPQLCPICQSKPKDDLTHMREGHYPLAAHTGRRQPSPAWQNLPMRGGDYR